MKKLLTKGVLLVFIVSLLFSFAACGKDKNDTTTGVPTTNAEATTELSVEQVTVSAPLSADQIQVALNSAGDTSWDGDNASLTDGQKQILSGYFAAKEMTVEFRDGNVYLIDKSGESTAPSGETTVDGVEGTTKKPSGAEGATVKPAKTGSSVTSVKLSVNNLDMYDHESKPLSATVSPSNAKDKSVTWKSDNEKVATVTSSGMVMSQSTGTANITCTANGNKDATAVCVVKVTKAPTGAVLSYLYNEGEEFFFIEDDPWQRQFGFNRLYDTAAPMTVMFYDTVRIKFNHAGKDWMIQMWKGQYGLVFIGSEIGVYTKDPNQSVDHYDCASDADSLKMEMSLYNGDSWLFTRTYGTYWWITGFVPGSLARFKDPSSLTVLARITLKDSAMKDLFVKGLEENGFGSGYTGFSTTDTYRTEGNSVYFNWKGASPLTRIRFDAAGGIGGTDWTPMKYGTEITPPEVTKEGYTFIGWKKALRSEIITFPQTVPSADTTYIAQWSKDS
ncbi:MAG: DUF4474 domain-containing protein [Clostridiales bacterium]|nr:DUF4474 domain-containing protein [Clostridiales bacterium]